jgi:hypothetical protein
MLGGVSALLEEQQSLLAIPANHPLFDYIRRVRRGQSNMELPIQ